MMELHVVGFILLWLQADSKAYWTVSNKPVIYGDNIILTCKTGHALTDRDKCPVRQWYGGQKNNLLLYNKVSRDATKYEDRTNVSSTEFSLVIKNYSESDLNINYTCSCGFQSYTKCLGLNEDNFIVPPLRVDTYIQQSNETLSIYLHVERVYPRPECSIAIGERTVFGNLSFTSAVKHGLFYNATYEASFNIVADVCGKKPTFLCYTGSQYNIVNTSGELIQNCTDRGGTTGYISTSTEAYTTVILKVTLGVVLPLAVLACLLTAVIIYKKICRHIQKIKETHHSIASDSDHRNKMLPGSEIKDTQTASDVNMNSEKYSLKSHTNLSAEHIL